MGTITLQAALRHAVATRRRLRTSEAVFILLAALVGAVGGALLMPVAWASPHALSAGHGAPFMALDDHAGLAFLAATLGWKLLASSISLGFGFGDETLTPDRDIANAMQVFDRLGVDKLAVVDADGAVLGIVTESHVRKRYAEERERSQREPFGEAR